MKKICILLFCLQFKAYAEGYSVERVLKDSTTFIVLELNHDTVFCTDRGYGDIRLKVSVPQLDYLAHFDHRVSGEALPCMAAGRCGDDLSPETIIRPNEKLEVAAVRVRLFEVLYLDDEEKSCTSYRYEQVSSYLRGNNFFHTAGSESESVEYDKCLKLSGL